MNCFTVIEVNFINFTSIKIRRFVHQPTLITSKLAFWRFDWQLSCRLGAPPTINFCNFLIRFLTEPFSFWLQQSADNQPHLSFYLSIYTSKLTIYPTVYLSNYLFTPNYLSNYLSIQLSVYPTFCLSNFLSIQLSVYPTFCLSNFLSIHLSSYII